jgi:hypothetical protein
LSGPGGAGAGWGWSGGCRPGGGCLVALGDCAEGVVDGERAGWVEGGVQREVRNGKLQLAKHGGRCAEVLGSLHLPMADSCFCSSKIKISSC